MRTSRSTESSRTRRESKASAAAAGSVLSVARVATGRPRLRSTEALGAKALLLGRRSYEFLAARWPSRSGPFADRLNSLPKYVVSSTLDAPVWNNTTVIRGDVINKVSKLKREIDGDILVAASFQLWHMLMEHDLVDELRLMIYPVVLGAGERLFGEGSEKKPMRLVSTRTVDDLALLIYELVPLSS